MSGETDVPLTRAEAFEQLRSALDVVADVAERLDAAEEDRDRRSVLLTMITVAWQLRDAAAEAYAALERAHEEEGIARGVLE